MEFHAWINPYRAKTSASAQTDARHITNQHPEWFIPYNNQLFFNPALPECREYILQILTDIITRYDVDYITSEGNPKTYEMISRNRNIGTLEELQNRKADSVILILTDVSGEHILVSREYRMAMAQWIYNFPAGLIDPGENPEESARRELWEETGLNAHTLTLFGVFSGSEMHFVYPNGDEVSNIDHVYLCTDWSGTPRPQPGEVEELRFFRWDELPEDIAPMNVLALRAWQEQKRGQTPDTLR
jgi:8-oxo-dGTP pyrophosphatase MutT (NUDIX family)